jgi:hypothetical protein
MAGDFIRWQKGLPRKPEVLQVASRLGVSAVTAAGHMMVLWEWADDVTIDGNVSGATAQLLDSIAGLPGLSDAMAATVPHPWLLLDHTGVTFVHYDRHNGQCAKKRMQENDRLRRWREAQKTETRCATPYETRFIPPTERVSTRVQNVSRTPLEKRRVEGISHGEE